MDIKKSKRNNIWKTIKKIDKKKNIIIRPADKGGGLVILNKIDYKREMANLLNQPDTYKRLKGNPKIEYQKKLKKFVKKRRKRNSHKKGGNLFDTRDSKNTCHLLCPQNP